MRASALRHHQWQEQERRQRLGESSIVTGRQVFLAALLLTVPFMLIIRYEQNSLVSIQVKFQQERQNYLHHGNIGRKNQERLENSSSQLPPRQDVQRLPTEKKGKNVQCNASDS